MAKKTGLPAAEGTSEVHRCDVFKVLIIGRDPGTEGMKGHPLYTKRALEPARESLVRGMMDIAILPGSTIAATKVGNILASAPELENFDPETIVVAVGRSRVIAAREVCRRRNAAAQAAGKQPPPNIQLKADYSRLGLDQLAACMHMENYLRQTPDVITQAEDMARLLTYNGGDKRTVATANGVDIQTVEQRLKLLELSKPVQAALSAEQLSISAALSLHGLPAKEQKDLLVKLLEDAGTTKAGKARPVTVKAIKKATGKVTAPGIKRTKDLLKNVGLVVAWDEELLPGEELGNKLEAVAGELNLDLEKFDLDKPTDSAKLDLILASIALGIRWARGLEAPVPEEPTEEESAF